MTAADKEALRQQMLLRALLGDARPGVVGGWMRDGERFARGLAAYRANAAALAERALSAAYPTLQQLLGTESFAALARAFWKRQPAAVGDVGLWGDRLADFIADAEQLAAEPYLADVAQLEWAVHMAARAADASAPLGVELLGSCMAARLQLRLAAGTAVLTSAHPVVAIWQAHRSAEPERFIPVRLALATGQGETARIARRGWGVEVKAIATPEARFTRALLAERSLAQALDEAGEEFGFESWLIAALEGGLLIGVAEVLPAPGSR